MKETLRTQLLALAVLTFGVAWTAFSGSILWSKHNSPSGAGVGVGVLILLGLAITGAALWVLIVRTKRRAKRTP